jgi:hypothetical protein
VPAKSLDHFKALHKSYIIIILYARPASNKAMKRDEHSASHSYASPPPSYTTNAPRSSNAPRRKSKIDEPFSRKRLVIRGVQFLALALSLYTYWEKHRANAQDGDEGRSEEGMRERTDRGDRRARERDYERSGRFDGPIYEEASNGSTVEYGQGSTVSGGSDKYLGERRRRRRERERRIDYS